MNDVVWTVKGDSREAQSFEILKAKDSNFIRRESKDLTGNLVNSTFEVLLISGNTDIKVNITRVKGVRFQADSPSQCMLFLKRVKILILLITNHEGN